MTRPRNLLCLLILAISFPVVIRADDDASPDAEVKEARTSPLGVRQLRVQRMMQDMELKFQRIAAALEKAGEPERAEKLIEALQGSKQLLIENRMEDIVKLLNEQKLDAANSEQAEVIADLKKVIAMLLEDEDDAQIELEQLEKWKAQINELRQQERDEQRENSKIANKDDTLADLARRIKAVEGLIKQQQEVLEKTSQERAESGIAGLGKVADKQKEVREQTEALADEIASDAGAKEEQPDDEGEPSDDKPSDGKPSDGKPSDGKPSDGKPSDGKPSDGKPSDGKPSDGKPSDGKPSDGKPSDGKPSDGKPSDGKPSDGKPSDGKPSDGKPSESKEAGAKELAEAGKHQKKAEDNLAKGKGKAAEDDEQQALAELEKALDKLKKEESRIASLPKEVFEEREEEQNKITDATKQVAKEMKEASQQEAGGEPSEGQPSEGQPSEGQPSEGQPSEGQPSQGKPKPGQKKVEQAQKAMEKSAQDLQKQDADNAAKNQDDAAKKLEEALQEIEERLAQLREEMQLERLAKLEARFREMLARQQRVTLETAALDKKKTESAEGRLDRRDRLGLKTQAAEEVALSEMSQQALEIILEDGTSVVFPRVVEQLRDDFSRVAAMMDEERTGGYTHVLHKDIEATLEELIKALEKAQQQKKAGEGGGESGGGNPNENQEPLLPNSAELKMLRAMQQRVNSRTESFHASRGDGPIEGVMRKEVENISGLQRDVAEMTLEIVER